VDTLPKRGLTAPRHAETRISTGECQGESPRVPASNAHLTAPRHAETRANTGDCQSESPQAPAFTSTPAGADSFSAVRALVKRKVRLACLLSVSDKGGRQARLCGSLPLTRQQQRAISGGEMGASPGKPPVVARVSARLCATGAQGCFCLACDNGRNAQAGLAPAVCLVRR
jgi:hypothetical protein